MNIITAGYIIHDNEGTIYGTGSTVDAAWADTEVALAAAQIEIIDDDADSSAVLGSWTRRSGLNARPATAALIEAVDDMGGAIDYATVRGVACTIAENEAE